MKIALEKKEVIPSVVKKMWRKRVLSCSWCKPNQNENAKRPKIRMKGWKDKLKKSKQYAD